MHNNLSPKRLGKLFQKIFSLFQRFQPMINSIYFRLSLVFAFIMVSVAHIIALPVIINGKSAAGDAFVFRVYHEADPISGLEVLLDQQRPDENGDFMLGFEAKEIEKVSIRVGLQSISFYVMPGKSYHLHFNEITMKDQNIFLPEKPLHVVFEEEDILNLVIDGFEYEYQNFLQNNFVYLIKWRDKSLYYDFEDKISSILEETIIDDSIAADYFNTYIDYRMAELRWTARVEAREKIANDWLTEKPIRFSNTAYSMFFLKYFDKYLNEYDKGVHFSEYKSLLNEGLPVLRILDKLGQDSILVKEKLRELVLLYSIKQIFYSSDMEKAQLNEVINYLALNSKFKENNEVASDLLKSLNTIVSGGAVPEFSLPNIEGQNRSLSIYNGKRIYLMFVSSNCETCEADIRILKSLLKENDNLQVITVFTGLEKEESVKWAREQNASWDFLWFKDDFSLLNDYRVKAFPKYILLDEQTHLLNYFPPKPRENLRSYLQSLDKQKEEPVQEASDFFRKN